MAVWKSPKSSSTASADESDFLGVETGETFAGGGGGGRREIEPSLLGELCSIETPTLGLEFPVCFTENN